MNRGEVPDFVAKPWLAARGGEYWIVTSKPDAVSINLSQLAHGGDPKVSKSTWMSCLMSVSDESDDVGSPIFISGDEELMRADQVQSAYRVILVRADNPTVAAYEWDQEELTAELARRGEQV